MSSVLADKKRATNFSSKEESLLIALAKKFQNILENKKSDTNANAQKAGCWLNLEKEFNSKSGETFRDVKVLKKKYENLKKRAKKNFSDEKCYMLGTGGGPMQHIQVSDVDLEIKEILGARIEGLPTQFGGDANNIQNEELENTIQINVHTDGSNKEEHDDVMENISDIALEVSPAIPCTSRQSNDVMKVANWSKYDPSMLKTPKSKALKPINSSLRTAVYKSEAAISAKVTQWAEVKSALEIDRKKWLDAEHNLKMRHMEEKHQKELQIMQETSNARLEMDRAEHKVKMEILQLEKNKLLKSTK